MAMSRRKFLQVCGLGLTTVAAGSLVGCGGSDNSAATTAAAGGDVANKDKPVVFFNRQPSNSSTGELDMTTLNWNANTYYVGFDANQGGELEGQMVVDYIKEHIDTIDRNGDGIIGYVLAIGDVGHNDSIARTRGCRKALGTAVEQDGAIISEAAGTNVDGSASVVKDGELEVNGKKYIVRELASQEMKNSAGATWDAATAGNALGSWATSFGDQIDVIVSNNPAVQAYLTLRLLRNSLDGVDINTGISTADDAGNVLAEDDYKYSEEDRSYYAMNLAVTAKNADKFADATALYDGAQAQLDASKSPEKTVWLDIYNAADNFLSATYQPLLQKYDKLLNLKVDYIGGDGQTESNITNRLGNPGEYDAFAINMVKTDNGSSYTSLLA